MANASDYTQFTKAILDLKKKNKYSEQLIILLANTNAGFIAKATNRLPRPFNRKSSYGQFLWT